MTTTAPTTPSAPAGLDRVPAPLLVVVSILSVQIGAAVARSMFDTTGALGATLLRLLLSALILLAVLRPRAWRWSRQSLLAAALLGAILAAMNQVFYLAIRDVPLGVAVTVEFIGPLGVALVQTRRWRDLMWVLLAGSGVALLGLDGDSDLPLTGLALAALAGVFWGAYIFASARVGRLLPGLDGLAVALLVGAVLAVPFGASGASAVFEDPWMLLAGLGVAVLSSLIPYGAELAALRRIPTRVFGVLMSMEPAAAALAGLVLLGQALARREVVALVLVTLASVGVTLGQRDDRPPPRD